MCCSIFRNIVICLLFVSPTFGDQRPPTSYNYPIKEIRFGFMKNDVRGYRIHHHHENGYNANLELLFTPPSTCFWKYIANPHPHLGLSINNKGGTNHAYFGLSWIIEWKKFLMEPSFGGDFNTAKRKKSTPKRQALGYPLLFREALSLGYKISPSWACYLTADHVSNARLNHPNPGITTFGIRLGYQIG